ncbi:MAG: hypothetical protein OXH15_03055 [Gammaproteobacteria bacterium]|nr:hypothetical protein [Gammaproteobacteria bacterium]
MANPFEKRATEYLRDEEAFLAVVTPEPLLTFFKKPAEEERLFDRLAMIIGTPGSGKTTLARLFQFTTLTTLLRNRDITNHKPLVDSLTSCGAIVDNHPAIVGGRLPLETEYREFWELPYPDDLKTGLMTALLQARAVLTWLRNLEAADVALEQVEIVPRENAHAALRAIGGDSAPQLLRRAREVEAAIYGISAALLPPKIADVDQQATVAYRPFDVISALRLHDGRVNRQYRPLIVFDDAHSLHPDQLSYLRHWLARRELEVARWILTRLDSLTPAEVLSSRVRPAEPPGLNHSREITVIKLQSGGDRARERRAFRKMAKDMSARYLRQMEVFNRRGLHSLGDLLSTNPDPLSPSNLDNLTRRVDTRQRRYGLSPRRRNELEGQIDNYLSGRQEDTEDLRAAILYVLLERYANRVPQRDLLTDVMDVSGPSPNRPLAVDSGVADGACIHLLHRYQRPYFFGIDTLCDAASENAEQFLQLAARVVSQLETRLIRRGSDAMLTATAQHKLLHSRASEILNEWDFPDCDAVRRLADGIAEQCVSKSLEGNASLKGGANAFGIPQHEFDQIPATNQALARTLQLGVAYNAFVLVPNYHAKKQTWCLIELGGILLLHHGLTLKRGGFLERRPDDLLELLDA